MKIRVSDITEKEKNLSGEEQLSLYPTLLQVQSSGECEFLSPVGFSLSIAREYDHIRVNGSVNTEVRLSCSRCLGEFSTPITSLFTIFYTRSEEDIPEDEVELGETDLVSASYNGDEIDFADEIAAQILLGLPYKPLCTDDCKGLCVTCGTDLNVTACSCSENDVSLVFSPLKGFKVKQ